MARSDYTDVLIAARRAAPAPAPAPAPAHLQDAQPRGDAHYP